MSFLRGGLSLDSRYAVCHLIVGTLLVVVLGLDLGPVVGFPVYDLVALALYLARGGEHLAPTVAVPLAVCAWVANSYLWGHLAAWIHRRVARVRPAESDPGRPDTLGALVQNRSERKRSEEAPDTPL